MRFLRTIIAIFSVLYAWPGYAGVTCGPLHNPDLLLKKIVCPSVTDVFIIAERHNDPVALTIKSHAKELSDNDSIYGFFEGSSFDHDQTFGLEDPLIYSFSGVYVASQVLTEAIVGHRTLPSIILDRIRSDLESGFQAIGAAPEDLSHLGLLSLLDVAGRLSEKMLASISVDSKYKYLNLADNGGWIFGYGRSILFAKKVNERFCSAASKRQNIWIQIGEGHGEQVRCLLKNYLPDGTEIQLIPASEFKDVYATWKTDAVGLLDEIKEYVSHKSPSAKISIKTQTDTNRGSLALVAPYEISVTVLDRQGIDLKDLTRLIERRGYRVVEPIDVPNEFLSFTITFDITKTKLTN